MHFLDILYKTLLIFYIIKRYCLKYFHQPRDKFAQLKFCKSFALCTYPRLCCILFLLWLYSSFRTHIWLLLACLFSNMELTLITTSFDAFIIPFPGFMKTSSITGWIIIQVSVLTWACGVRNFRILWSIGYASLEKLNTLY